MNFRTNAFEIWDKTWLILTCGDFEKGKYNSMTVAWGSLGNMWNLPLAMVVVRPTRFTFQFIQQFNDFTLCAFPETFRKSLDILGSKSGRDGDKIGESGLTPIASKLVKSPIFEEADLRIECRKMYWQDLEPKHFLLNEIESHYPLRDYHRIIFGNILIVTGNAQKYFQE